MGTIDPLLKQISDPVLREKITKEIAELENQRTFGLVYEKHLPEAIRLPNAPIRRGSTVMMRDRNQETVWNVTALSGDQADLRDDDGNTLTAPLTDLVLALVFGQRIYPGLRPTGSILRGGDKPHHLVINAENHHALTTLRFTHAAAIDVIYIDPPYNTGGDFAYNDKFVGADDRFRHSKWLSFMEKRLVLARDLLKPTGVIFVSIDDNEQAYLRILLDQVFGPTNFVESIVVEMSTTSGPKTTNAQQGTIVKNCEFVHVYRRGPAFDDIAHTPLLDGIAQWDKDYALWLNDDGTITDFVDEIAADPYVWSDIKRFGFVTAAGKFGGMAFMDRLLTVSEAANEFVLNNLERIGRRDIPPVSCADIDAPVRGWIEVEADHRTYILTRLRSGTLNQVYTLARNYRTSDDYRPRYGRTVIRGDLWKGFFQDMGNVAKEGGVKFSNGKKPIRLVKQLVRWANNDPEAVVLDFFAGSGTTAHAVMAMNAEDGGRRQSIIVTNNEVDSTTANRLDRAGLHPGDEDWEAEGIYRTTTRPRIETTVTGIRPDGSTYSQGLDENVTFTDLTYLERLDVERQRAFASVAHLLWLRAGARGDVITEEAETYSAPPGAHYGVLFDVDSWSDFVTAVKDRADVTHAFVVTDSDSAFAHVEGVLPDHVEVVRMYESYLSVFETTLGGQ